MVNSWCFVLAKSSLQHFIVRQFGYLPVLFLNFLKSKLLLLLPTHTASYCCTSWISLRTSFSRIYHRPDFSAGTTTSRTNARHPSPVTNSTTSSAYFDKLNAVDAAIKSSLTVVRVPFRGWKNSRPLLRATREGGRIFHVEIAITVSTLALINKKCERRKRSTECYYSTAPGNHLDCSA